MTSGATSGRLEESAEPTQPGWASTAPKLAALVREGEGEEEVGASTASRGGGEEGGEEKLLLYPNLDEPILRHDIWHL